MRLPGIRQLCRPGKQFTSNPAELFAEYLMVLIIIRHANEINPELLTLLQIAEDKAEIVFPKQIREWFSAGKLWKKFRAYSKVFVYAPDPEIIPESSTALATALFMGRRACSVDARARCGKIGWLDLACCLAGSIRDRLRLPRYLADLDNTLTKLEKLSVQKKTPLLKSRGNVCYLRPDLIAGLKAGGSVGHIAGVINSFPRFGYTPTFFSVENLPMLESAFYEVRPENRAMWSQEGMPAVAFSPYFAACVEKWINENGNAAFIYQRHGLNTWAGAEAAMRCGCPFVLEYNGSEVWVARHWGTPLAREELGIRLENLSLNAADLIVVISRALAEELIERGFDEKKILVNPNGVNTDMYSPEADGRPVLKRLNLEGRLVIGFIGTFGRWHGAEKLAAAWGMLIERRPEIGSRAHLLFIGDGLTVQETKDALDEWGASAIFTGTIPQAEGPAYLAACDILVAPHVPNADGSKFFGSPTKLFEYMAMGKAIVASDLEQLGEVIRHEETGLLVAPGNAEAMSRALERLLDDASLRQRLAGAARKEAEAGHTWERHTAKIVDALKARCGG